MSKYPSIRLEAIEKGRDLGEVLDAYMDFHKDASEAAAASGKTDDEVFAMAMQGAIYRLYLLGVEDGMNLKECGKNETV